MASEQGFPKFRQVVLDSTDIRALAEFYRQLLGFGYRSGDDPLPEGEPDLAAQDWLVLVPPGGGAGVAFQRVSELVRATWPEGSVPQQLHLDFTVATMAELTAHHARATALGAVLLLDRSDDPEEMLRVYADPAGHPFCIFVSPPPEQGTA